MTIVDKIDPQIVARVRNECLIFRKSSLEEYREKYGDELKVIFIAGKDVSETASASGRGDT